ncbi:MAG TPA: ferrochelatase [Longimicrobiales bacterium]|nr:ferrochelatase [Longimicrobiales bacterium]
MKSAVLLLNFGEPEQPVLEEVVTFLERIFSMNDALEGRSAGAPSERARKLAAARAPGLIEEYRRIGGSPLRAQAREQASLLEAELTSRGHDVVCIVAMQFTEPFIIDAIRRARAAGVRQIVALPIYPLCGPSTTVAALQRVESDLRTQLWSVPVRQISGWHRHPAYLAFRAAAIRAVVADAGLSLDDARTKLVFSAHGTPMKYIEQGSRYDVYVREFCAAVASAVGAADYAIGYQNHTNRPIEWTQPDVERVVAEIDAEHIVVDPVSFMHEQSETLGELDHELKSVADARGLGFHRVPIHHAAPEFISLLADLTVPLLDDGAPEPPAGSDRPWGACRCKPGAHCLNAVGPGTHSAEWPV